MSFAATWIDIEIIILSEVSQTEKDKYNMISHMWNLIKLYKRTYKTEINSQISKAILWLPLVETSGGREEGINQEFGINKYTTIHKIEKQQGFTA